MLALHPKREMGRLASSARTAASIADAAFNRGGSPFITSIYSPLLLNPSRSIEVGVWRNR